MNTGKHGPTGGAVPGAVAEAQDDSEGAEVHLDWRMTPAEWDELRGALALRQDRPYIARLAAEGKLGEAAEEPAEPPLPPGRYGRVELPGYRQHTGWITEENRFGLAMAVVRDWDGQEMAAVAIGPASQVVYLPTPLKRPDPERWPARAIEPSLDFGDDADLYEDGAPL